MHLKQHYEPPMHPVHMERKPNSDCETDETMIITGRQHQVDVSSENLIEALDDSQENIKDEEDIPREPLPIIDEFNEFSEQEEDMMEDLRKEVDKVVETIGDNACLSEGTWNYQASDEIDTDNEVQNDDDLQLYSENLNSNYDEIEQGNPTAEDAPFVHQNIETSNYKSEDEDDEDLTLEQVRQSMQKPVKVESDCTKFVIEDDNDIELTECLKKIHNFKCSIQPCNKAFNSRTALGYHLKTHTTERRFVCDQVLLLVDLSNHQF